MEEHSRVTIHRNGKQFGRMAERADTMAYLEHMKTQVRFVENGIAIVQSVIDVLRNERHLGYRKGGDNG